MPYLGKDSNGKNIYGKTAVWRDDVTGRDDPDLGNDYWLELGKPYRAADGGADLVFSMDGGKLHTTGLGVGRARL